MWMPGTAEWIVIAFLGLLIFGKGLPERARGIGSFFSSIRKGMDDE